MPDDSDHVLDSIDGAVDEWLAMSDDSMRWSPPEKAQPKPRLGLPVPGLPQVLEDFLQEVGTRFGPPAQAVVDVFRPLGEGVADAVSTFLDSPPVRQLLDPPDGPGGVESPREVGSAWNRAVGDEDHPVALGRAEQPAGEGRPPGDTGDTVGAGDTGDTVGASAAGDAGESAGRRASEGSDAT